MKNLIAIIFCLFLSACAKESGNKNTTTQKVETEYFDLSFYGNWYSTSYKSADDTGPLWNYMQDKVIYSINSVGFDAYTYHDGQMTFWYKGSAPKDLKDVVEFYMDSQDHNVMYMLVNDISGIKIKVRFVRK